jgi:hypothetical protein
MVVAARGADFLGSAPKGFKEELARQVSECPGPLKRFFAAWPSRRPYRLLPSGRGLP